MSEHGGALPRFVEGRETETQEAPGLHAEGISQLAEAYRQGQQDKDSHGGKKCAPVYTPARLQQQAGCREEKNKKKKCRAVGIEGEGKEGRRQQQIRALFLAFQ